MTLVNEDFDVQENVHVRDLSHGIKVHITLVEIHLYGQFFRCCNLL